MKALSTMDKVINFNEAWFFWEQFNLNFIILAPGHGENPRKITEKMFQLRYAN